jgi:hypothetical protein
MRLDQRTSQAQLSHQTDSFNCCITAAHIKGIGCARIERQTFGWPLVVVLVA